MSVVARTSLLAFVVVVSGCGTLPEESPPDAAPGMDARVDAPPVTLTTYRGTLAMAPTARFGGTVYCPYSLVLSQVEVEVTIATTGQLRGATSQGLAVETRLIGTTPAGCTTQVPGIPPNILKFTFKSATQTSTGYTVLLDGDPANEPRSAMSLTLTPSTGAYSAVAKWTRTDQVPELTWTVNGNLTMAIKP